MLQLNNWNANKKSEADFEKTITAIPKMNHKLNFKK